MILSSFRRCSPKALFKYSSTIATPPPPRASSVCPNVFFNQQRERNYAFFSSVWPPMCSSFSPDAETVGIQRLLRSGYDADAAGQVRGNPKTASKCKLTPLDRFSSDAVMPNGFDEKRAGGNRDWIVTVGPNFMWDLTNVYTRRKIVILQVSGFEPTKGSALTFQDDADEGQRTKLQKIVICQVPTAGGGYKDFSLVAIFEFKIVVINGNDSHGWSVCVNEFQGYFRYCDAIIQHNHVFAMTENGCVYACKSLELCPILILSPCDVLYLTHGFVEDDEENDPGRWWLARSVGGSRLLLVYTYGDDTSVVHYGRTVRTYPSGFECMVFSMDTSHLTPANRWKRVTDLRSYSLFLGVNYPIIIAVGDANDLLAHLMRRNCVYTSHQEVGYEYRPRPEICCSSLNGDAAIGFHTSTRWTWSETPFWFIPSFSNALEWNEPIQG